MSQSELATAIGIKPSSGVISNWERDLNKPDAEKIVKLCDVLNISVSFLLNYYGKEVFEVNPHEQEHIKKYRDLDSYGRQTVDIVLDREITRVKELNSMKERIQELEDEPVSNVTPMRIMSYYQRMASAGSGEYLFDDIPTDLIEVEDTPLSQKADFVLRVNGHSMEPTYNDGDNVLVRKTSDVPIGHIVIFIKGSNCYIKELGEDRLISHNEDKDTYPDIYPDDEPISIVGEVLGKV